MHDPRIGRFFAVDPLAPEYPELTPYQFSSNSPIYMVEIEGLEGKIYVTTKWYDGNGSLHKSKIKVYTVDGLKADLIKICWKMVDEPNKPIVSIDYYGRMEDGTRSDYSIKDVAIDDKPSHKELNSFFASDLNNSFNSEKKSDKEEQIPSTLAKLGEVNIKSYMAARNAVTPDAVSVDFQGDAITPVGGVEGTYHVNWILKGKDASLSPIITFETTQAYGFSGGFAIGLSQYNKFGSDFERGDFETRSKPFVQYGTGNATPSYQGSLGLSAFGKFGFNGGYTETLEGDVIINAGSTFGVAPPGPSGSFGRSNTVVVKDFNK